MKKAGLLILVLVLIAGLTACGLRDTLLDKLKDRQQERKAAESLTPQNGGTDAPGSTGANPIAPAGLPGAPGEGETYDAEFVIVVGASKTWTPVPQSGTAFQTGNAAVASVEDDGKTVTFKGVAAGDAVITAEFAGGVKRALVKVRQGGEGTLWQLTIDEVTVLDMMGLAQVSYALDLTAMHEGPDMLGTYSGTIAMNYEANLDTLAAMLSAGGGAVDYETKGWFVNDAFTMDLMAYTAAAEDAFVGTIMDESTTAEDPATQAIIDAYLGNFLAGIGGGEKGFETANTPKGFWYDWAFHMTDGDMSGYFNMTGICMGMVNASVSQDAQGKSAQGYVDVAGLAIGGHVIVSPVHENFDYAQEMPFPYTIEVYESGEAVFTLRTPNSPITVKFYGRIEKI